MSEYIGSFSIQEEIMKRLPVDLLIRCRSVSKAWKSLIDNSQFITAHSHHRHTRPHHLLVSHELVSNDMSDDDDVLSPDVVRFLSFIDDDTFPRHLSVMTAPLSVRQLLGVSVVGCSHGLVCVHGYSPILSKRIAVLWNPSIRKSAVVDVPEPHAPNLGFGVCPITGDPKLLLINYALISAKVFTLSSGEWKSITMPQEGYWSRTVTTEKFIYLRSAREKIVSFDLTRETFEATALPDDLTSHRHSSHMSKIRDSLAIIISNGTIAGEGTKFAVWMYDDVQRSFTHLFNIIRPSKFDRILGSRKNGMLIMLQANPADDDDDIDGDDSEPPSLVVFEPSSGHTNLEIDGQACIDAQTKSLEIEGFRYDIDVEGCEETLLLLNCHSDCGFG